MQKYAVYFGRFSLALIYVWFGVLKLIDKSPANPLVSGLLKETLPFISFSQFIIILGIAEIIIGILFLLPKFHKIAVTLFFIHMVATFAPLIMIPKMAWQNTLIPTLEGQYIIKNAALISIVLFLSADRKR